jgi:hypothetical protein
MAVVGSVRRAWLTGDRGEADSRVLEAEAALGLHVKERAGTAYGHRRRQQVRLVRAAAAQRSQGQLGGQGQSMERMHAQDDEHDGLGDARDATGGEAARDGHGLGLGVVARARGVLERHDAHLLVGPDDGHGGRGAGGGAGAGLGCERLRERQQRGRERQLGDAEPLQSGACGDGAE